MNVKRCEIGHYYDVDKYGECCPHCTEIEDEGRTETLLFSVIDGGGSTASKQEFMNLPVFREIQPEPDEDIELTQCLFTPEGEPDSVTGWLVGISGGEVGRSYNLKVGRNFVGRGKDMDVALLGDIRISRNKHAIITYEPRQRRFFIQPGEARELIYVNDEVVLSTRQLEPYDRLLMGVTELLFVPFCCQRFAWEDLEEKNQQ